jgi:hypothetical protein
MIVRDPIGSATTGARAFSVGLCRVRLVVVAVGDVDRVVDADAQRDRQRHEVEDVDLERISHRC